MKILAHVHQFPPTHNAGAEWMLHDILERLATVHGHECTVITNRAPRRDEMVGPIKVTTALDTKIQARFWQQADVVLTHLDATQQAMMQARTVPRPLVHLVHNHSQLAFHKVKPQFAQLVVANSQWIQRVIGWPGRSTVVIPPVWGDRLLPPGHGRDDGPPPGSHDCVALLNMNRAKGADIFFDLARAMPDVRFLAVQGAYGHQVHHPLPNVELIRHTPDVWKVYARAKVVLMPSSYESWGRVAVEAAWCHVPTIAGATPGLIETKIPARFCSADAQQGEGYDPERWKAALTALLDDDVNARAGATARVQAEFLEDLAKAQVDKLAAILEELV